MNHKVMMTMQNTTAFTRCSMLTQHNATGTMAAVSLNQEYGCED